MSQQLSQPSRFAWRLFWILFGATVLSALAALPFAIELIGPIVDQLQPPPFPFPLVILFGAIQNLALIALMVALGLKLGTKLGLGPQLIRAWRSEERRV